MTVPCGMDAKGLPIGLQLIGDCFKEKNILRAGYAFERARGRAPLADADRLAAERKGGEVR